MTVIDKIKIKEAESIVLKCIGGRGIWASPVRYKYQRWTRVFVIAIEDVLLDLKRYEIIKKHLTELFKRQKSDGKIPILFLNSTLQWLVRKIRDSIRQHRLSFTLKKFFSKDGVAALSPWTRDSEILFVIGAMKYAQKTQDQHFLEQHKTNIDKAIVYIKNNLIQNGLVYGVDWRDTRPDLDKKFLLTNNCLLYKAYKLVGKGQKAEQIRDKINQQFWTGTHYRDYVGVNNFDTLGNAFTILFDITPLENYNSIFMSADVLNTPFGYKLNKVILPPKTKEEVKIMSKTNQVEVIWPFIHGFMILAAIKSGKLDIARTQFKK